MGNDTHDSRNEKISIERLEDKAEEISPKAV